MILRGRQAAFDEFQYKLDLIKLIGDLFIEEISLVFKDQASSGESSGSSGRRRRELASTVGTSTSASTPAFVVATTLAVSGRGVRVAARARNAHDTMARQTAGSLASRLGLNIEFLGEPATERFIVYAPRRPPAQPSPVAPAVHASVAPLVLWALVVPAALLVLLAACVCALCVLRRQGWLKRPSPAQPQAGAPHTPTSPTALASPGPCPSRTATETPHPLSRWGSSRTMTTTTTYWSGDRSGANNEDDDQDSNYDAAAPSQIILHQKPSPRAFQSPEVKLADLRTPRQRTRHPSKHTRRLHTPRTREEDLLRDIYASDPAEVMGEGRLERELAGWREELEQSRREERFRRQLRTPTQRTPTASLVCCNL